MKGVAIREHRDRFEFQGLTGISALSLKRRRPGQAAAGWRAGHRRGRGRFWSRRRGATQDVTAAARDALRKVQEFIEDNQKAFKSSLCQYRRVHRRAGAQLENVDEDFGQHSAIHRCAGAQPRTASTTSPPGWRT